MRVGRAALLGLLAAAMVATTGVPEAAACSGAECGIPACDVWETVKVRPEMARTRTISCRYAVGATLETPPEHGEVTDVSADWQGLRFTMRADADAPREDSAVFDVEGHEGSVDVKVTFRVLPESENSAPVCEGDAVEQRSSGEGPVELYMHPWCYDPDDDEFVMDGGGPGEHRRAPLSVAAGRSESNWPYTTKTSSGRETGTVWATDVLGARSAEAELRAHVGPGVDRRANCHPNPWYIWGWESAPVHTRPGAIRRFAVICADEDGDPFVPTLGTLPQRGVLTMLTVDPPSQGWSGYEQWVEASYVPAGEGLERDEFSVVPRSVERGDGTGPMVMVPRAPPANGGGSCSWSGLRTYANVPGTVSVYCTDDDGDEMTATLVGEPRHGTAGPVAVAPGKYGGQTFAVPYVPDPGFEGYDCVKIAYSDGHGLESTLTLDIYVVPAPVEPDVPDVPAPELPGPEVPEPELPGPEVPGPQPPDPEPPVTQESRPEPPAPGEPQPRPPDETQPQLPDEPQPELPVPQEPAPEVVLPPPPSPLRPAAGNGRPGSPVAVNARPEAVSAAAQEVLAADLVVPLLVRKSGPQMWAVPRVSRRELLRKGRAAALYVVCAEGCTVEVSSAIRIAKRKARPRDVALQLPAGQPSVLWVAPSPAERRRLRRARGARASFQVTIGDGRPQRYAIPISR